MSLESIKSNQESYENRGERIRELADFALVGISNAWQRVEDPEGLPLSADFAYQAIQEELDKHAFEYGEALFKMARATHGSEKLKYAKGLMRMLDVVEKARAYEVLKSLLTNKEAVEELVKKAEEEAQTSREDESDKGIFSFFRNKQ